MKTLVILFATAFSLTALADSPPMPPGNPPHEVEKSEVVGTIAKPTKEQMKAVAKPASKKKKKKSTESKH